MRVETVLALEIPTEIPRVGFTFETIFIPFASGSENPFTGMTAQEIGRDSIRDNSPEVEIELNLEWLRSEDTGGWVGSHFDIVDKISPAERPQDAGAYTHKLNFELDTAVNIFNWLPEGNWLRNIELEGSLDYVATGLPRAGRPDRQRTLSRQCKRLVILSGLRHPARSFVAVTRCLKNSLVDDWR